MNRLNLTCVLAASIFCGCSEAEPDKGYQGISQETLEGYWVTNNVVDESDESYSVGAADKEHQRLYWFRDDSTVAVYSVEKPTCLEPRHYDFEEGTKLVIAGSDECEGETWQIKSDFGVRITESSYTGIQIDRSTSGVTVSASLREVDKLTVRDYFVALEEYDVSWDFVAPAEVPSADQIAIEREYPRRFLQSTIELSQELTDKLAAMGEFDDRHYLLFREGHMFTFLLSGPELVDPRSTYCRGEFDAVAEPLSLASFPISQVIFTSPRRKAGSWQHQPYTPLQAIPLSIRESSTAEELEELQAASSTVVSDNHQVVNSFELRAVEPYNLDIICTKPRSEGPISLDDIQSAFGSLLKVETQN